MCVLCEATITTVLAVTSLQAIDGRSAMFIASPVAGDGVVRLRRSLLRLLPYSFFFLFFHDGTIQH